MRDERRVPARSVSAQEQLEEGRPAGATPPAPSPDGGTARGRQPIPAAAAAVRRTGSRRRARTPARPGPPSAARTPYSEPASPGEHQRRRGVPDGVEQERPRPAAVAGHQREPRPSPSATADRAPQQPCRRPVTATCATASAGVIRPVASSASTRPSSSSAPRTQRRGHGSRRPPGRSSTIAHGEKPSTRVPPPWTNTSCGALSSRRSSADVVADGSHRRSPSERQPTVQPTTSRAGSRHANPSAGASARRAGRSRARGARRRGRRRSRGARTGRTRDAGAAAASASSSSAGHHRRPGARVHGLVPADRRQPATAPGVADVADRPQGVGHRDHGARDAVHAPRGRGELGGDQRRPGEDPAAQRQPDADGDRVRRRPSGNVTRLTATSAPSTSWPAWHRRAPRSADACRLDGGRPEQLLAPALLLGARVPADQEHAHQPGTIAPNAEACHITCPPMVLSVAGRAGHRDECGVARPCSRRPCRTPPGSCTAPSR